MHSYVGVLLLVINLPLGATGFVNPNKPDTKITRTGSTTGEKIANNSHSNQNDDILYPENRQYHGAAKIHRTPSFSRSENNPTVPSLMIKPQKTPTNHRRRLLKLAFPPICMLCLPILLTSFPSTSLASSPPSLSSSVTAEKIRGAAANIPGYGQKDLFYPNLFSGRWKVSREMVRDDTAVTLEYQIRFLTLDDGHVVSDRGFNEASLINADVAGKGGGLLSADWEVTNPNDLTLIYTDGRKMEVKVTKRGFQEEEEGGGMFSSSEYRRVTDIGGNGIPSISGGRVLNKWRKVDERVIEGIELVYSDGGGFLGDPVGGDTSAPAGNGKPKLISKSRLRLERMN